MALVRSIPQRADSLVGPQIGPFGLAWLPILVLSEIVFIVCRAGSQHFVRIDEAAYWIIGLVPFIVQFCFWRLSGSTSTKLVQVWIASLATYLMFQLLDVAHVIELPINLTFDFGLGRSLVTAVSYVSLAIIPLLLLSVPRSDFIERAISYAGAAVAVAPILAIALFQAY